MTTHERPYNLPMHRRLPEPNLQFRPQKGDASCPHPLTGLVEHGPFSKHLLSGIPNPIRIAFIGQKTMVKRLHGLMRELEETHNPKERKKYLPTYLGFSRIFETNLVYAGNDVSVVLPDSIDNDFMLSKTPHQLLSEILTGSISSLRNQRHAFDIVFIGLDEKWSTGFEQSGEESFNLHDYLKGYSASAGIPLQVIRDGSSNGALDYFCRCSVMWRLAIAIYTKAGGIPWALAHARPNTAFIGIDYAIRVNSDANHRFAICCSQVFDADGAGLDFIAYEADDIHIDRGNPYLRKNQMLKIMARSLQIYQRRHAGDIPARVVVHKNTDFREAEIDGCLAAFNNVANVELVRIQESHGWQGVFFQKEKHPDAYPCHRGQVLPIGENEALLWTQGNIPTIISKGAYFKEGKGIPSPLLVSRFAGRGDFFDDCAEILALTKMNWNTDGPYTRLPVTLENANVLAQIVKRMPKLESRPYPIRLFM